MQQKTSYTPYSRFVYFPRLPVNAQLSRHDLHKTKPPGSSLQNAWYADFKNKSFHYIIFCNKIFKVDRSKPGQYNSVTKYGLSLGIPDYQLDFSPHIKEWKR